jgi:4-amino-4-deoxy-L-arabinose transferase-like glycosyltransferase
VEASRTQARYRRAFWILLGVTTFARLVLAGQFGLSTDEAHYVLYARRFAWGYVDHPPLVGVLGAVFGVFGDGAFFVRLGPILCWGASNVLLRALAIALYRDERVAFGAAALMLCMPLSHLLALGLLPDATLNLFWCGGLLAAWFALREGKWRQWVLVGVLFGGALLSKYHGVLLPACVFCFVVSSRDHRHWLRSPRPYVAFLIGLTIFLPNVIWNLEHDWISYAYQLGQGGGSRFKLKRLFESVGGQLGGASPIILILLVAAWVAQLRRRPLAAPDRFVIATSLPVFVLFWAAGLKSKLLPHWAFVGWWTGALCLVVVVLRAVEAGGQRAARWRRWTVAGAIIGGLMVAGIYAGVIFRLAGPLYRAARDVSLWAHDRFPGVKPLKPLAGVDPFYGWDIAARRVEAIRAAMPRPEATFVFGHRYYNVSPLAVYLDPSIPTTSLSRRVDQYRVWFDPKRHVGWDALFVDSERFRKGGERYAILFRRVDLTPVEVQVLRGEHPARTLFVYRCFGYRGGYEPGH